MKDLTQGSVLSHALTMAVPIFAGLVLVLLCGLIDLYFVAGFGEAAVAGVGAAGNAGFLVSALTQIVSVGTLAAVSQAVGRKDRADANFIFNQSLGLSAVCGICTLAVGFAVARPYMNSVAADAATVEAGTTYLVWFMPALALQFAMLAMASALRGIGIVTPTMAVQALTVTINVILAPVLIVGWGTGCALGVKGAGLASSLAVAIGVVTLWAYFQQAGNYLTLDRRQWRPQIEPWKRILSVGLPAGGEFAIMFAYMAAIYYAIGVFGPAAQAGFSIGSRVLGLIQVPAMAIAFTAAPIIGQNFGARNGARVKSGGRKCLDCGHGGDGYRHRRYAVAARASVAGIHTGQGHDFRRRVIPENGFAQPRRAGPDFCVFERLSGTGQYEAATHQFDGTFDNLCDPDLVAIGAIRLPRRTDLVLVDRHDHDAGAAQSLVVEPGTRETAGFLASSLG